MRYADITGEEGAGVSTEDLPLFEMANLGENRTGIAGTIFISTQQGSHGPRVKYYEGRPGNRMPNMSVSVTDDPMIVANSLGERVTTRAFPQVQKWVQLNREKLLNFWHHGNSWMDEEVDAFKASLTRLG